MTWDVEEADFLAERRQGVGASDVHHLFNERPWGCSRRLYYEKSETPADFKQDGNLNFARGKYLEPAVAERYAAETKRFVEIYEPAVFSRETPWLRCHVDRFVGDPGYENHREEPGVLECKTANSQVFATIKRDGLPTGYIWQLQYAMGVTGRKWGSFAVLHPDSWRLLYWDMDRDETMVKTAFEAATTFWRNLESKQIPPPLIDEEDARCSRCPWRVTCRGQDVPLVPQEYRGEELEEDDALVAVLADYREAKSLLDDVQDTFDVVKARLVDDLKGRYAVSCHGVKVYHRPQISNRVDTKLLRERYPQVAEECTVQQKTEPLRVYFPKDN